MLTRIFNKVEGFDKVIRNWELCHDTMLNKALLGKQLISLILFLLLSLIYVMSLVEKMLKRLKWIISWGHGKNGDLPKVLCELILVSLLSLNMWRYNTIFFGNQSSKWRSTKARSTTLCLPNWSYGLAFAQECLFKIELQLEIHRTRAATLVVTAEWS